MWRMCSAASCQDLPSSTSCATLRASPPWTLMDPSRYVLRELSNDGATVCPSIGVMMEI
jgi:cytosine/uracil/thiamine/allantoin permease